MKKSTLKEAIKTKIKSLLSEGQMTTDEAFRVLRNIQNNYLSDQQKDVMGLALDALQAAEVSRMMDRERGLTESLNPEVTTALNRFIKAMAKRYDYEEQDAVYAIMAALEQRKSDTKYDMPGFGDTMDALDDISIREEEEKFQMTYKGDPVHLKISKFGGNTEGAKDTVLFVNVGGIGKSKSKASKNALEKRLGLLDQEVNGIMFTNTNNISKEIKDISKDDFKIKSVLSEEILVAMMNKSVTFADIREDEMTDAEKKKAAEKDAKKEKIGKQASKLSQADEDRYERIKNGLEKLKKKGDEESIKKMKAILGKKDVEKLIKSKGRTKSSFM